MSTPSTSFLFLSVPIDNSAELDPIDELNAALTGGSSMLGGGGKLAEAKPLQFPEFKTGTLASLLTLSDSLTRYDAQLTAQLAKTVEQLRSLLSTPGREGSLSDNLVLDDGRPYTEAAWPFKWNDARWRVESRSLTELVDGLVKESQSVENALRVLANQYQLVKGQLQTGLRKKTGNLSIRSLAEVVSKEDFAETANSEYLETVLVAVPKNIVKEWETSYERLASMVVPRSSTKLATDDEFVLYSVTIFRRVKDEFSQKAREHKFIVRDFSYDEEAIEKAKKDLADLEVQERELWTDLLRLARLSFGEVFQLLLHLKVVKAFSESVLRYGLPANYFLAVVKPDPKQQSKVKDALRDKYASLAPSARKMQRKGKEDDTVVGEYATVLEGDYSAVVVVEVEPINV